MSTFYVFMTLSAFAVFPFAVIMALTRRMRKGGLYLGIISIAAIVFSVPRFEETVDGEAKAKGFLNMREETAFEKSGATDLAAWRSENSGGTSGAAVPDSATSVPCEKDLRCWGDKYSYSATSACKPAVEKLAAIDYRWTDGFLEQKFSRFNWSNMGAGRLIFFGDAIQFQNEIGNWIRYSYSCVYNPQTNTVDDTFAKPGRLNAK